MTYVIEAYPLEGVKVTIETDDQDKAVQVLEALAPEEELTEEDITGPLLLQAEMAFVLAFRMDPTNTIGHLEGLLGDMKHETTARQSDA